MDLSNLWNPNEELCGVIIDNGTWLQIKNVAKDRKDHFIFDKSEWLNILNTYNAKCIWHTHPSGDPTPSEKDIKMFESMPYDMLIIGSNSKTYWLKKEHINA